MIADYYDGLDLLPEGNLKISPSGFADFFENTNQWFRENMLGESGFQGNTSTHLGTVIHAYVEKCALNQSVDLFHEEVEEYLETIVDPSVNKDEIRNLWLPLGSTLVNSFVESHNPPESTEQFIHTEVIPGVSVGGTYDALRINAYGQLMVVDWKTASKKPSALSKKYQWQALIYCYILRKNGIKVDGYEVNFVSRATATIPPRGTQFAYIIQQSDMDFIESLLKLVAESMLAFKNHPTLRFLLAQDYRLYQGPITLESNDTILQPSEMTAEDI